MVNKPFWHISDVVLAPYTFSCVKMSDFMPNNRHLREMLIFFFHSKKTAAEVHRELQKVYGDAALSETTCRDWFRRFKHGDFDVDDRPREWRPKTFEDADVIYYDLLKPNGEWYRTQLMRLSRALHGKWPQYEQILRHPIITCSDRWHMVWLISSSAHMKTSKNGLIRGEPQKMNTFTVTVFELHQKDGQKL